MKALINKEELFKAIKRISTITSDKSKIIQFKIDKDILHINAMTQDEGEAVEEMDIKYSGEPIEVSYNAVYLLDVLRAVECEELELSLTSSMSPGTIRAAGNSSFIYVIMPIRK